MDAAEKLKLADLCVNTIRFLSIDAVDKANSGHPGTPMGLADIAFVVWTEFQRHDPRKPHWENRDRFVHDLLAYGLFAHAVDECLHHGQRDVSLEQRHAHFAQRVLNIGFVQPCFAAQCLDDTREPSGQVVKHGMCVRVNLKTMQDILPYLISALLYAALAVYFWRRHWSAAVVAPEVTPALDVIIAKCLRHDPTDRYQSAGELLKDLEQLGASLLCPCVIGIQRQRVFRIGQRAFPVKTRNPYGPLLLRRSHQRDRAPGRRRVRRPSGVD